MFHSFVFSNSCVHYVAPSNSGLSAEVVGRRIQGVHCVTLSNSGLNAEIAGRLSYRCTSLFVAS